MTTSKTLVTLATLATTEAVNRYTAYKSADKKKETAGACIRRACDLVYNCKCPNETTYIGALSSAADAITLLSM